MNLQPVSLDPRGFELLLYALDETRKTQETQAAENDRESLVKCSADQVCGLTPVLKNVLIVMCVLLNLFV